MRGPVVNFGDERLPERFWDKVQPCPMTGCWIWTASLRKGGYAAFSNENGETRLGHCIAYKRLVGPIQNGLELDHLCRVRCCVNPAHLEPVTRIENVRRGIGGLVARERILAKTHCPKGHEYAGENLRFRPDGARVCRACHRAQEVDRKQRQTATGLWPRRKDGGLSWGG